MKIRLALYGLMTAIVLMTMNTLAQDAAPAGDTTEAAAPRKKTLLDTYKIGGWAMHPLLLCSIGVVGVSILNARNMTRKSLVPAAPIEGIKLAAEERDVEKVVTIAQSTDSLVTNALVHGLRLLDMNDPAGSKTKVEEAVAESMGRQESKLAFWLNFLQLITAVAPMMGLLGTVSGMIGAFDKIGMGGMGKPELLAANIGEAMVTTATGLIVAIPAMFAYFFFRNYLNKLLSEAEEHLTFILDSLTLASE
ncbi:MAG: MotA/TolQ/ExbB proton channel family protein [Kiritimatiellia bacterium]|jgi:biopolymer transport protein ExbB